MKSLIVLALGALLSLSASVSAWDFDFHFHVTYLICRDLGMKHEFCRMAAACSEWTDQSLISGPFLIPKTRAFNHFNGPYHNQTLQEASTNRFVAWFKGHVMVSHPDSPVPHAYFMDALKDHDLTAALMHLHSIQDLDPHSRFYSSEGHPTEGHWPDRYWLNEEMIAKFKGSVRKTYQALWAVRQLLPQEALELDNEGRLIGGFFDPDSHPDELDNPDLMAKKFLESPEVKAIYTHPFTQDPRYVVNGLVWFFDRFKDRGIVNADVDYRNVIPPGFKIDGETDLPSAILAIIEQGEFMKDNSGADLFHMDKLMQTVFPEFSDFSEVEKFYFEDRKRQLSLETASQINEAELDRAAEASARHDIANRIATFLSKGFVPVKLDSKDYVDMFEADVIRKKEMDIRQSAWNDVIQRHTGERLSFDAKLVRNSGFVGQTLRSMPGFHPDLFAQRHMLDESGPVTEVVSVPMRWRGRWLWRQWKKVLLRRAKRIHSPAFLNGARDYYSREKFKSLVDQRVIRPFSASELFRLERDYDSLGNRAWDSLQNRLSRKSERLPPKAEAVKIKHMIRQGEVAECSTWLLKARSGSKRGY